MLSISGIDSGLMNSYVDFEKNEKLSQKELFQMLSLDVGGDSDTITKTQLDAYLEDIDFGYKSTCEAELNALKSLQKYWDVISLGKNCISFENMINYPEILISAVIGETSYCNKSAKNTTESSQEIDATTLLESLDLAEFTNASESDLTSYIRELLSTPELDNDIEMNTNLIDSLTNLISSYSAKQALQIEA